MAPFYGWGSTSRRQFTFYHSVPRNSWYPFYWPQKDERLSRPWSHTVVLNTWLLDWESSALTTRPLDHSLIVNVIRYCQKIAMSLHCYFFKLGPESYCKCNTILSKNSNVITLICYVHVVLVKKAQARIWKIFSNFLIWHNQFLHLKTQPF